MSCYVFKDTLDDVIPGEFGTGCKCNNYDCGCCLDMDIPEIKLNDTGKMHFYSLFHKYVCACMCLLFLLIFVDSIFNKFQFVLTSPICQRIMESLLPSQ